MFLSENTFLFKYQPNQNIETFKHLDIMIQNPHQNPTIKMPLTVTPGYRSDQQLSPCGWSSPWCRTCSGRRDWSAPDMSVAISRHVSPFRDMSYVCRIYVIYIYMHIYIYNMYIHISCIWIYIYIHVLSHICIDMSSVASVGWKQRSIRCLAAGTSAFETGKLAHWPRCFMRI